MRGHILASGDGTHRTQFAYGPDAGSRIVNSDPERIVENALADTIYLTEFTTTANPMESTEPAQSPESTIYEKLTRAPLYATYRKAFMDATGLGLQLIPFNYEDQPKPTETSYRNSFCAQINRSGSHCAACSNACRNLYNSAEAGAQTISCFANLRETAIPIRAGGQTVALLTTGQVFTTPPTGKGFEAVEAELEKSSMDPEQIRNLRDAWMKTPHLPVKQYEGIITLLAAFAIQFSDYLNRLLVEESHAEPNIVMKAKRFINAHLEEKVCLEEVSRHVGVSTFYFCKIFKQTTGMTLTEFVNRRRIERAKQKLLNPQNRVTEVAFEVGYQSLSQFNRSFLKYVGISPSRFRERQTAESSIQPLVAA